MLQQKESYDVLRLIEHGQLCYISSENVQGKTLDRYLKYHPVIKKREIFLLLKEIACIFRKNCASVPEERSAIPLQTEQSSAG